jgi:hypothetical protein
MIVAILTLEQKEQLQGQQYATDSYFNPIQDLNNNWVISQEEIEQNTNVDFNWLANLKLVEHLPKNNNI